MSQPKPVEADPENGPRPAPDLRGRTVLVTGSSRGVGAAIALRCAEAGANVVITGKTSEPHGKLPGTIHSVAEECERRGGKALAVRLDLRDEDQIFAAAEQAAEEFGGIDIVVNNASAQTFTKTPDTTPKQWDVMFDVNARGTFFTTQACLPWIRGGSPSAWRGPCRNTAWRCASSAGRRSSPTTASRRTACGRDTPSRRWR